MAKFKLYIGFKHIQWLSSYVHKTITPKSKKCRSEFISQERKKIREQTQSNDLLFTLMGVIDQAEHKNMAEYSRKRKVQRTVQKKNMVSFNVSSSSNHQIFFSRCSTHGVSSVSTKI